MKKQLMASLLFFTLMSSRAQSAETTDLSPATPLLNCRIENLFEASTWTVSDNGENIIVTYAATQGFLVRFPEIDKPLTQLGLLKTDEEGVKSITFLFDRSRLIQHPSKSNLIKAFSGPTKIIAEVNIGRKTSVQREASLFWANFSSFLVTTTDAEASSAVLKGKVDFYGEGTNYYPIIERDLSCQ